MVNGFTYSQHSSSRNSYYCSKKDSGCKGKVKLGSNGEIMNADFNHSHEPPQYMMTKAGHYIKVSK